MGQPISCQWFGRFPPDQHALAAETLKEFPNLRFCASTTGQTNFTFVLWVNSPADIFEPERRIVALIPGLLIHEKSVTIRFNKSMGWRLDDRGRQDGEPIMPNFFPTAALEG